MRFFHKHMWSIKKIDDRDDLWYVAKHVWYKCDDDRCHAVKDKIRAGEFTDDEIREIYPVP